MFYRVLAAISALLTLGLIAAEPARADVAKGTQLARQWCANCHVIANNPSGGNPNPAYRKARRAFPQSRTAE